MGANIEVGGGERLVIPVILSGGNSRWMTPYGQLDISAQQPFLAAQFQWKVLAGSVVVSEVDKRISGGREAVIPYVKARLDTAEMDIKQVFNQMIFNDGSDATIPAGLAAIASASDPSAGALGGISRVAYPSWSGYTNTATKTLEASDMASGWVSTTYNNQPPDLILTTQTLFRTYEAVGAGNIRFSQQDGAKIGDMGFEYVEYKGATVMWDRDCPAGDVFFLNTDYIHFFNLGGDGFNIEGPTNPYNQLVDIYKVYWIGQLACEQPRSTGVLTNKS